MKIVEAKWRHTPRRAEIIEIYMNRRCRTPRRRPKYGRRQALSAPPNGPGRKRTPFAAGSAGGEKAAEDPGGRAAEDSIATGDTRWSPAIRRGADRRPGAAIEDFSARIFTVRPHGRALP